MWLPIVSTKIGKGLNVSAIVEGSIRLSKETISVTAQWIVAQSDFYFWSETWDRNFDLSQQLSPKKT